MTLNEKKVFVFVVCGDDEHIETLNFSMHYLKHFTGYPICVITDTSRNRLTIAHDSIIDIKTPEHFNHHQASIYLKTGIYKWVNMGENTLYCYLDTDIIALNDKANDIFNQYKTPISFAPDHCTMPYFSDAAVYPNNLDLKAQQSDLLNRIKKLKQDFPKHVEAEEQLANYRKKANSYFIKETGFIKRQVLKSHVFITVLRQLSSLKLPYSWLLKLLDLPLRIVQKGLFYVLNQGFYLEEGLWHNKDASLPLEETWNYMAVALQNSLVYNPFNRLWYDCQLKSLIGDSFIVHEIQITTTYRKNGQGQAWKNDKGEVLQSVKNDWLQRAIKQKFDIAVTDNNWQHWNGGAFLFDHNSIDFLENWHQFTLQIFEDPLWKTRDQGTLIATVWKFSLQNHPILSKNFNLIADYYNTALQIDDNFVCRLHNDMYEPSLLHVFHHWGDNDWDVWRNIEKLGKSLDILP